MPARIWRIERAGRYTAGAFLSHDRLVPIDLSMLPDEVRAQAATIASQQVELDAQQVRIALLQV